MFKNTLSPRHKQMYEFDYESNLDPNNSYYIYNSITGTGKTFQAIQLAKKIVNHLVSQDLIKESQTDEIIAFVDFGDLAGKFMRNYLDTNKEVELAKTIPILILDDIGLGNDKSSAELAFMIVNYRLKNGLQTIFTSNYDLDTLIKLYDHRIDRIAEICGKDNFVKTPDKKYRQLCKGINLQNSSFYQKLQQKKQETEEYTIEEARFWSTPEGIAKAKANQKNIQEMLKKAFLSHKENVNNIDIDTKTKHIKPNKTEIKIDFNSLTPEQQELLEIEQKLREQNQAHIDKILNS